MLKHDVDYVCKACRACGMTFLELMSQPVFECRGYRTAGLGDAFKAISRDIETFRKQLIEPERAAIAALPAGDAKLAAYTVVGRAPGGYYRRPASVEETACLNANGYPAGDVPANVMDLEFNLAALCGGFGSRSATTDAQPTDREARRFDTPGRVWLPMVGEPGKHGMEVDCDSNSPGIPSGPGSSRLTTSVYVHPRSLKGRVNVAALAMDDPCGDDVAD